MPAFEYEALDTAGVTRSGVISADTARLARRQLRQSRLMPVKLAAVSEKKTAWRRAGSPSAKTLMVMTRQLATMIGASAPLEEALHTIALQSDDKTVRAVLLNVRGGVLEGFRLADAMAQQGPVFPPLYRALVGAGEISGNLGAVLERLADHLEKSERLKSKVQAALIYPLVLSLVAAVVVAILMVFVVPKVVAQFADLGSDLPLLTRALIFVSEGLARYGWILLLGFIAAGASFSWALRQTAFRRRTDQMLLDLPIIGKLLRGLYAARLARTLSTLIASGSPIVEGLNAAKATIGNLVLLDAVARVVTAVKEGASLSGALRRTGIFPPMVVYMSAVGENTGRLDVMLTKAAEHLENEFESFTGTAVALLEPLIVVVMGGVVATIMLAILMPILQLNTLALN